MLNRNVLLSQYVKLYGTTGKQGGQMSEKFDIMLDIIRKIDRKEQVSKYSLMDEFEISERSVFRYIDILKRANIRITYDKQKGSYIFEEGFSISKPELSDAESLTLALAKGILKNFGTSLEQNLDSLELKLKSRKKGIKNSILLPIYGSSEKVKDYLEILHAAICDGKSVNFLYQSSSHMNEVKRTVDPYYIFFSDSFWYVRGHCHNNEEFRVYALDRIRDLKILDNYYPKREDNGGGDLVPAFGPWIDGEEIDVLLRFDTVIAEQIQRIKWVSDQKTKVLKNGRIELSFKAKDSFGLLKWLLGWSPHVEVISPVSLRKELNNALTSAANKNN